MTPSAPPDRARQRGQSLARGLVDPWAPFDMHIGSLRSRGQAGGHRQDAAQDRAGRGRPPPEMLQRFAPEASHLPAMTFWIPLRGARVGCRHEDDLFADDGHGR